MPTPFEDTVIQWIQRHPRLAGVFIVLAALSMLNSAVQTVKPVAELLWPRTVKLVGAQPSDEYARKVHCAHQLGKRYGLLTILRPGSVAVPTLKVREAVMVTPDFATCAASITGTLGAAAAQPDQANRIADGDVALLTAQLAVLEQAAGRLYQSDPHYSDLLTFFFWLEYIRLMDRFGPERSISIAEFVLDSIRKRHAQTFVGQYEQMREKAPYKLPDLRLDAATREGFAMSVKTFEVAIGNYGRS